MEAVEGSFRVKMSPFPKVYVPPANIFLNLGEMIAVHGRLPYIARQMHSKTA